MSFFSKNFINAMSLLGLHFTYSSATKTVQLFKTSEWLLTNPAWVDDMRVGKIERIFTLTLIKYIGAYKPDFVRLFFFFWQHLYVGLLPCI